MRALKVKRADMADYIPLGGNQHKTIPNDACKADVKLIPGFLIIVRQGRVFAVPEGRALTIELEEDPTVEQQQKPAQPQQQVKR